MGFCNVYRFDSFFLLLLLFVLFRLSLLFYFYYLDYDYYYYYMNYSFNFYTHIFYKNSSKIIFSLIFIIVVIIIYFHCEVMMEAIQRMFHSTSMYESS